MRVILLRHGRAGDPDPDKYPDDRDRPLTPGGEKRLVKAAGGLAQTEKPAHVMASQSNRTMRTAEIMHEHAGWPEPKPSKLLRDGGEPQKVIDKLNDLKERNEDPNYTVALVGHEPQLSALGSYMLTGDVMNSGTSLKKGGAALIQYHPQPGKSTLQWMMPAKALARLHGLKHFNAGNVEMVIPLERVEQLAKHVKKAAR